MHFLPAIPVTESDDTDSLKEKTFQVMKEYLERES